MTVSSVLDSARDLRVGHHVEPVVTWGSQRRLMCPACKRYMGATPGPDGTVSSRCGAAFRQVEDTDRYQVVNLP